MAAPDAPGTPVTTRCLMTALSAMSVSGWTTHCTTSALAPTVAPAPMIAGPMMVAHSLTWAPSWTMTGPSSLADACTVAPRPMRPPATPLSACVARTTRSVMVSSSCSCVRSKARPCAGTSRAGTPRAVSAVPQLAEAVERQAPRGEQAGNRDERGHDARGVRPRQLVVEALNPRDVAVAVDVDPLVTCRRRWLRAR